MNSRWLWIAIALVAALNMSLQAYNLGHSRAKWAGDDENMRLREKHSNDIWELQKKRLQEREELEAKLKKLTGE